MNPVICISLASIVNAMDINEIGKTANATNTNHRFTSNISIPYIYEYLKKDANPIYDMLEEKIKKISKIKTSEFIDETPNAFSIKTSKDVFNIFKDNGVVPAKISALSDGGVVFEYFTDSSYNAISIYNDKEIIYLTRPNFSSESTVDKINLDEIKEKLSNDVSSSEE